MQPLVLERQLPFVDDEAGVELARCHGVEDLVERTSRRNLHLSRRARSKPQLQREERGRQRAGHGDRLAAQVVDRQRLRGDDHRAVVVAHAAPAGQQGVLVEQVAIGVDADGGHFQFALAGPGG